MITGASAGVGRAAAHRFARAGARVGLIARDADALNDVKGELEGLGGAGFVGPADVSNPDEVFAAADSVVRQFGPIDVWINDAMVTVFSPVWKTSKNQGDIANRAIPRARSTPPSGNLQ
ncbi:SDR family NAD(P)-dependent oxidoreductase [Bradyrhizobium neotropicale]|uniref:SDR family NAD(P)-dependent oxidoreductase n=1 Tax=Bradyrhizobium neotropicale TaxID=1497615 RepID=UPI00289A4433|nr:SDR family NAD(P)-dependent oxidoreductase [Bradyrhizobium neotropicale]